MQYFYIFHNLNILKTSSLPLYWVCYFRFFWWPYYTFHLLTFFINFWQEYHRSMFFSLYLIRTVFFIILYQVLQDFYFFHYWWCSFGHMFKVASTRFLQNKLQMSCLKWINALWEDALKLGKVLLFIVLSSNKTISNHWWFLPCQLEQL